MTADSPWHIKQQEKLHAKQQKEAEKKASKRAHKKDSSASQQHSMGKGSARRGYVELSAGKSQPHGHSSDESEEELRRKEHGPGKVGLLVIHFFGTWNKVTQPICLLVLSFVMILVWYLTAYRLRESLEPIEHATPPVVDGVFDVQAGIAFVLGSLGTVLYNAPRIHQLYITLTEKSTEGIEPYMFVALIGENVGTLISILVVSQDKSYLFAEAPYLAGCFLAIGFDLTFLALHYRFAGNPRHSGVSLPWSSPTYIVEHQLLATPSLKTDALHRKTLTRRRRDHLQDSAQFAQTAPLLTAHAHQNTKAALHGQREALDAAQDELDRHVESSGDEARITAHQASRQAHHGEEHRLHAANEWHEWSADAGPPLRSASQRSRGSAASTMAGRG